MKRNIYFTTPEIKDIVNLNFDRLTVKKIFDLFLLIKVVSLYFFVQIINTGVKLMARSDNKGADCGFRIAQEVIVYLFLNLYFFCD